MGHAAQREGTIAVDLPSRDAKRSRDIGDLLAIELRAFEDDSGSGRQVAHGFPN
jgi:hypothetical protein